MMISVMPRQSLSPPGPNAAIRLGSGMNEEPEIIIAHVPVTGTHPESSSANTGFTQGKSMNSDMKIRHKTQVV